MHRYTLTFDSESVNIRTETDLSPIFSRWKDLPFLTGVEVSLGGCHEYTVEYTNAPYRPVSYSARSVHLTLPIEQLRTGEALLYAAMPYLEILYQQKRVVTMHAAAVDLDGRGILLLGKTGAGKTSITLSLCRNHRARLIGNDIARVGMSNGVVTACAGSKYFFLRQESIKRNTPDLLSLFPKSTKDSWAHKIYCLPEKLGISVRDEPTPIRKSYLVHIDETMDRLYTTNADNIDTRLYLNENMGRYIRGTAISLFGINSQFMGYIPSFDTPELFEMRAELIEAIISTTEIVYLSGNLHDACRFIVLGMDKP